MSESGDPDAATRTSFRLIGPDRADWVPDRPSIDEARFQQHARGASNIEFRLGSIERLPKPGAPYDVALFSWSL